METIDIMGYSVFIDKLTEIPFGLDPFVVNTINPHSYIVARKDPFFQKALKSSDIILPDGSGIVWASRFLTGKAIQKISGYDLFYYLMGELNKSAGSCFFLGSSPETLNKIHKKAKLDFPNITIGYYSPPFKAEFSEDDDSEMIAQIVKFKPQVLFVGMTAPKQEKWVNKCRNRIPASVICSIGAVFDFYAGTVKRSSHFWINIGLEWVPRFIQQPRRLWRRVFVSNPLFVYYVIKNKIL